MDDIGQRGDHGRSGRRRGQGSAVRSWAPFEGSLCLAAPLADLDAASPYIEEQALHARAPARRRHESIAARHLAREALQRLGGPVAAIGRDTQGVPQWPAGWTGSLSHGGDLAAAIVGDARRFAALGIDVEPAAALPEDAAAVALDAVERAALEALPGGYARWSRAAFAAKESLHKCVHPARGAWLEFDEVRIRIDPRRLGFGVEPLSAAARRACSGLAGGLLRLDATHVFAALAMPRGAG